MRFRIVSPCRYLCMPTLNRSFHPCPASRSRVTGALIRSGPIASPGLWRPRTVRRAGGAGSSGNTAETGYRRRSGFRRRPIANRPTIAALATAASAASRSSGSDGTSTSGRQAGEHHGRPGTPAASRPGSSGTRLRPSQAARQVARTPLCRDREAAAEDRGSRPSRPALPGLARLPRRRLGIPARLLGIFEPSGA